jgi:NAD(P)H-flavin reductase
VNPRNTVAATCGPPIMYRFVLMELLGKGIPESQIYLSLERRMKCGVGKCGHCQINHLYCCQDGPVFTYAQIKGLEEAL